VRGSAPAESSTSAGNPPSGSRDTSAVSPQRPSTGATPAPPEGSGDPGRRNDPTAVRPPADQTAVSAAGAPRAPTNRQADGQNDASVGLRSSQGPGTDRVDATVDASASSPGRPQARGQGAGMAGATGASAGGIGAAAVGDGAGAGGVEGRAVTGGARAGIEGATLRSDATRRYAAAQRFASTPAASDQVPPDLRAYVRAYFGAITARREGR
jgi:hypothetical protein